MDKNDRPDRFLAEEPEGEGRARGTAKAKDADILEILRRFVSAQCEHCGAVGTPARQARDFMALAKALGVQPDFCPMTCDSPDRAETCMKTRMPEPGCCADGEDTILLD